MGERKSIVFIVDDDVAVSESIKWLVESVGLAARSYGSGRAFLAGYEPSQPGCLVTDMRMPEMSGLELQERLSRRGVDLPVIVMTAYGDVTTAVRAMKKGAVDFVEKPFNEQNMLDLIHDCLKADIERRGRDVERGRVRVQFGRLSAREREVMRLIVDGKSNKEVARLLDIVPKTVETHRSQVMDKMAAATFADLVRMAHTCL